MVTDFGLNSKKTKRQKKITYYHLATEEIIDDDDGKFTYLIFRHQGNKLRLQRQLALKFNPKGHTSGRSKTEEEELTVDDEPLPELKCQARLILSLRDLCSFSSLSG